MATSDNKADCILANQKELIGIYGGTFDPIHNGHLRSALDVQESIFLDELRFVPSLVPPHREQPGASAQQRLEMLKAALQNSEHRTHIDTRELERTHGPSYTVDTLESLTKEKPESILALILGMDAFQGLGSWHRWREITTLCHIVVMHRPGYEPSLNPKLSSHIKEKVATDPIALKKKRSGLIYFIKVTPIDISASDIRTRIHRGSSARHLTPDPVLDIIKSQKLYGSKP
jgi:nicotinate-nucleotide adenylyltransferase